MGEKMRTWNGAGRAAAFLAVLTLPVAPAGAQRPNDPSECPYCEGDPERMAAAALVSHGGFEFGKSDTAGADRLMATSDIRWIETAHLEIGIALGSYKVRQDEKNKVRAELARLAEVLPQVDPRARYLDPWLRVHLYAQRAEEIYRRFQELMQVSDEDFAHNRPTWDMRTKYMGMGPYLGEMGKYEILILPSEAALTSYLKDQFGLLTKKTQRWNVIERDSLTLTINARDGDLRNDQALHGHVAFNLGINLLDGYKHYSYETPIWIREGLGHFLEREINPKFNTFDSSEGAVADMTNKERWEPEVRKLVQSGKAPRMAQLVGMDDYADLDLDRHYATWSMVQFLVKVHPDGFACINDRLHGRMNAEGYTDGSNLGDVHREAFQECLGMSYPQFDAAWSEWVMANYSAN